MDDEEILQMVVDGDLEPDQVEDFRELDPELQELVQSGDIDVDETLSL